MLNNSSENIIKKINLFMNIYIIPKIDPNKIYWWFSMSGGKDSFVMAYSIYKWYKANNYQFHGEGICFRQWDKNIFFNELQNQINWIPITVIDVVEKTNMFVKYNKGEQAPCSLCSSVRKCVGDKYITENYRDGYINILARGLHLSDMAISFLWRDFWRIDTTDFALSLTKGNPFVKLDLEKEIFLCKPLCFVREYESQSLSNALGFKSVSCGCPAYKFPSRRDIVEESLRMLFNSDLWEFDVHGIDVYLNKITFGEDVSVLSSRGKEKKEPHLPIEFIQFAVDYWEKNIKSSLLFDTFSKNTKVFLDAIGIDYLVEHKGVDNSKIYYPKLLSDEELTEAEKRMVATAGPFWGAIGYDDISIRNSFLKLQQKIYGIEIDRFWSQVIPLLNQYYKEKDWL